MRNGHQVIDPIFKALNQKVSKHVKVKKYNTDVIK